MHYLMLWPQYKTFAGRLKALAFFASCGPVPTDKDPLTEFDKLIHEGPVSGGDAIVGGWHGVDVRWVSGFGHTEFRQTAGLQRNLRILDVYGRCGIIPDPPENANTFWAKVLCALRSGGWRSARGAVWAWTERSSINGRGDIFQYTRITWLFAAPDLPLAPRWELVTQIEQSVKPS